IEVTSDSTRNNDFGLKRVYYHRIGIDVYIIIDADEKEGRARKLEIIPYEHRTNGYQRMPLQDGRFWLEDVRCWLGQEDGRGVCYDADGKKIESYAELNQARDAAEQGDR